MRNRTQRTQQLLERWALTGLDQDVVHFLDQIFEDAISLGASDIHVEPFEEECRIRFRWDGMLETWIRPPAKLAQQLLARIKILAHLDIAERRLPQDGRFYWETQNESIDFRVSTCPTLYGEKAVLRILKSHVDCLTLDELGLRPMHLTQVNRVLEKPQGLMLVTGPTGSGKTQTLYAALQALNREHLNVSTVEDPVEIRINGVNQVAVHPKIGLSFSQVLRAFMRQDPDVMMVGEIRDAETADIAVKAAQTGHLVLSTLHAKSTLEAFQRLQSLGISAYNLATSLTLVMAQRLVRKLCRVCAISLSMLDPNTQFFQANPEGCSSCHRGYRGRFAIFEVLEITPALQQAIFQQSSQQELTVIAEQLGWRTLYQEGLEAVAAGMTSLDELERVVTA